MKKGIHPDYHPVVFKDARCGAMFFTRSTMTSKETIEWEDGNTYPLIMLDTSSASHPIYTGKERIVESEGRVAKFQSRFSKRK